MKSPPCVFFLILRIFRVQAFSSPDAFRQPVCIARYSEDPSSTDRDLPINLNEGKINDSQVDPEISAVGVRETELGRMARGVARTGWKDEGALQVGDVVVAKAEIPSLNVWVGAGYEIIELYSQGVNAESGQVEKIPLNTLDEAVSKVGYTEYLKVYSPKYHKLPVIVSAAEMGLRTIKAELTEAMWLAIPGFFWVFVASAFASNYNAKYGGNFFDAFFRT